MITVYIDGVAQSEQFDDADRAMTWAEMNSRPGSKLRIHLDHAWVSPDDAD